MTEGTRGARVLAIDDEPDVLDTIEDLLLDEVWEVVKASTYEEALEQLERGPFEAVVLDLMGVRGLELLERFGARVPCLVLTGHALSPETLREAIRLRARAYIPKAEMGELSRYLRIVLSAPQSLDLWQVWLHPRYDLLGLRTHLGPDFERTDADFFESVYWGARWHEACGQLVEHEGGVVEVRHNEPPLNLITPGTILSFRRLLMRLREEPSCRAIVHASALPPGLPPEVETRLARRAPLSWLPRGLRAGAARAALRVVRPSLFKSVIFSVGMSLEASLDPALMQAVLEFGRDVFLEMFYYPKPYVAALAGPAIAGGLELALSSHYLVGDRNAVLMLPEMKLGFPPPAGIPLLVARVGAQRAFAITADTRLLSARQGAQLGLLDRLVKVGRVRAEAVKTARRLADRQAVAGLQMARGLVGFDMHRAMEQSFAEWQRLMDTPIARANVARFFERRGRTMPPREPPGSSEATA